VLQDVTSVGNGSWIDRGVSFVDVPDDSFLIDQEGGAIPKALLLIKHTIVLYSSAFEVAEYWEGNAELFGEFAVSGDAINTHTENLGFGVFEFSDISLIRFKFLRSTTCECQHVNGQHDVFLAFEIAKLVGLPVSRTEVEFGSGVTDFQVCFAWCLLGQCGDAEDGNQHQAQQQS